MNKLIVFLVLVFVSQIALADLITQNISNGCYDDTIEIANNNADLFAIFTPNSHTCASGYFLPANMDECYACGPGQTCVGGTYSFNENISQGIERSTTPPFAQSVQNGCVADFIDIDNNNDTEVYAIFTPNSHTCTAGQYLPAGIDACTQCPANSYCGGGTFTFNETTDQGIESCGNGYFSPSGSSSSNNCYPHVMHIGNDNIYLKSTKLTTPSLNVQVGNDIFYANMTTTRIPMNKDTTRYLHAQWGNNDYYICDDTTCPNAE